MLRASVGARVGGPGGGGSRRLPASTVLAIASSGSLGRAGAAPAATARKDYPPVDISKLVVREFPAGTPQTTATAVADSSDPRAQGRLLDPGYVEKEFLVQGDASTYSGPVTGPVEVTQTNVPYATRVLVRYPKDASKFSGRVVVEPFNTSDNGTDNDACGR